MILRLATMTPLRPNGRWGREGWCCLTRSTTPSGNNLVLHPGFVALTQRLMGYLNRGSSARLVLGPGDTFELPVAMELLGRDFSVMRPGMMLPSGGPGGTGGSTRRGAVSRYGRGGRLSNFYRSGRFSLRGLCRADGSGGIRICGRLRARRLRRWPWSPPRPTNPPPLRRRRVCR